MADAATRDLFRRKLEEDAGNGLCCDTDEPDPQWVSVSHGIFISIDAAGVHRGLGVRVSFVQSIRMDSLKPLHLKMMELGGNARFQEFLDTHNVPADIPIREKYCTRAASWYRESLRAQAEGREGPPPLAIGTGHLPAWGDRFIEAVSPKEGKRRAPHRSRSLDPRAAQQHDAKPGQRRSGSVGKRRAKTACGDGISELESAPSLPDWLASQLLWLVTAEGRRTAERLKTISTGTMQGIGPKAERESAPAASARLGGD